jgi:diaminopimelate dehydrogenase
MQKIKAAIIGYGNIGKYLLEAIQNAPDFELTGIVRRNPQGTQPAELDSYRVVASVKELPQTEVAILVLPAAAFKNTRPKCSVWHQYR